MPRIRSVDIHVRLSERASVTLRELEAVSGFSGSRLIEEIILAVNDVMENYANFEVNLEEKKMTSDESTAVITTFLTALDTILSRLGYEQVYDETMKAIKKESAERKEAKERAEREKKHSGKVSPGVN